ncbi:SH3 domain-containing protein [Turicibacter sanguinis]|uniref:SH3 domain-containing protein n=1 Tax=Turicibacter sanguinis TaxID=154288 RepID=UPI0006C296C4|nr:SH3 domain-containing protein [Turicibacter sanguinis]MDB8438591.1 SH3 domain-containing protein [Turicibacter sanguinis]MTO25207.1 hypothetical protein [Turicibacter sanguinis]MTO28083.1 hypothetical protein [Turicibacter sanguinis]MTO91085.1 hypothetical protein [Turicibacter sanguinis]MTP71246.1 hypothetical protein [Turicibacter sanguinis]
MVDESKYLNLDEWRKRLREVFKGEIPDYYEWTSEEDIIRVLKIVGERNVNHTFYPDGGGMDVEGVCKSFENGYIEIYDGLDLILIKPNRLRFYNMHNGHNLSYFILELQSIKPIDNTMVNESFEKYIDSNTGKIYRRYLKGKFAIFAKKSDYNLKVSMAYDALHNNMNNDNFEILINRLNERLEKCEKLKKEVDVAQSPVIDSTLTKKFRCGEYGAYVITTDDLNIRKERNHISERVGTIPKGTKVKVEYILGVNNSKSEPFWGSVYTSYGNGFINLNYTKPTE